MRKCLENNLTLMCNPRLDMVFLPNGTEAFITFHGSLYAPFPVPVPVTLLFSLSPLQLTSSLRETTPPVGYRISSISFDPSRGLPTSPPTSTTSTIDIISNSNSSFCPSNCFRPVGMALDTLGRLFVSSDATGEIWVVVKTENVEKKSGKEGGRNDGRNP